MKGTFDVEGSAMYKWVVIGLGRSLEMLVRHCKFFSNATKQWENADGSKDAERWFGRHSKARCAVCVHCSQRDIDKQRAEGKQTGSSFADEVCAVNGRRCKAVVHEQPSSGGVLVATFNGCKFGVLPRTEKFPLATHTSSNDLGQVAYMVFGVRESFFAPEE